MEDAQLNGYSPEVVVQQRGNIKSPFSNACRADMNQITLHACSDFSAQKEAYVVLRWNIDVNDEEHCLVENTTSS